MSIAVLSIYLIPLLGIVFYYHASQRNAHTQSINIRAESRQSGLTEPASLHPIIDPLKCIGCGSCVKACPENLVLGVIDHKAELIAPSHCIGHGACKEVCPEDAISLVFGTETRGVDIPELSPEFETSVPGVYIAGELGGMGLIRNAIEQGKQAMAAIRKNTHAAAVDKVLDVLIVGAGPSGIAAALYAIEQKMSYRVVEQDSLGGTVSHFPRGKLVMTAPANLPLVGKFRFGETSKEELLGFWQNIENEHDLNVNYHERLESVSHEGEVLRITTSKGECHSKAVLLAIGRRGTPRKLGVPGEELDKVSYRLLDSRQFRDQQVLVVGGGDSALEAAHSIADEQGASVILSYRGDSFNRAKEKNRQKVSLAQQRGNLTVLLASRIRRITDTHVYIDVDDDVQVFENDHVIICAGGVLPNELLKNIGIDVSTKYGTA